MVLAAHTRWQRYRSRRPARCHPSAFLPGRHHVAAAVLYFQTRKHAFSFQVLRLRRLPQPLRRMERHVHLHGRLFVAPTAFQPTTANPRAAGATGSNASAPCSCSSPSRSWSHSRMASLHRHLRSTHRAMDDRAHPPTTNSTSGRPESHGGDSHAGHSPSSPAPRVLGAHLSLRHQQQGTLDLVSLQAPSPAPCSGFPSPSPSVYTSPASPTTPSCTARSEPPIATLVWLYLTSFSVLLGAQLNGVLFRERRQTAIHMRALNRAQWRERSVEIPAMNIPVSSTPETLL